VIAVNDMAMSGDGWLTSGC